MNRITFFGVLLLFPILISADDPYASFWTDKKYLFAQTAGGETYLSMEEKEIYYYLNLARMAPARFADVYVKGVNGKLRAGSNELSLYNDLKKMKPAELLKPDKTLHEYALCWANEAGKAGFIGHDRKKCVGGYSAECCDYGNSNGLDIVLDLLIDDGVPSLGHRHICLGSYSKMGVSIKPHKGYGVNAVLDFW